MRSLSRVEARSRAAGWFARRREQVPRLGELVSAAGVAIVVLTVLLMSGIWGRALTLGLPVPVAVVVLVPFAVVVWLGVEIAVMGYDLSRGPIRWAQFVWAGWLD